MKPVVVLDHGKVRVELDGTRLFEVPYSVGRAVYQTLDHVYRNNAFDCVPDAPNVKDAEVHDGGTHNG